MHLYAEISPGELFDKITILEIKSAKISDPKKLSNVKKEHHLLKTICDKQIKMSGGLQILVAGLKKVNNALWQIEDEIRDCERRQDFGEAFIKLARSVYIENDQRALFKNKINRLLNSKLFEEKSYAAY